jgi:hypothetical protein
LSVVDASAEEEVTEEEEEEELPGDPVPGMLRLLRRLVELPRVPRVVGRGGAPRVDVDDLYRHLAAADGGHGGRVDAASFVSGLRAFAPALPLGEAWALVEGMGLHSARRIDYADFCTALAALAG